MTSDLTKITSGFGPSAARLQLLIDCAQELSCGMAALPQAGQAAEFVRLKKLLKQITAAAHDTANEIEASGSRIMSRHLPPDRT